MTFLTSPFYTNILDEFFCKDLFDSTSTFFSVLNPSFKASHPLDIIGTKDGVEIDIASVGTDKEDIKIKTIDNKLTIEYSKKKEESNVQYIYRGLSRKSFKLEYSLGESFDLKKLTAKLDKGILKITIPFTVEAKEKSQETIINIQ